MMTKSLTLCLLIFFFATSASVQASMINTGNVNAANTNAVPLDTVIAATPRAVIRLDVGGSKFANTTTPLSVAITVDCSTPAVIVGAAADQSFRDDAVGAAYFGYFMSLGVRSAGQTAANVNLKIRVGGGASAGRTYGTFGNGATVPNDETDLIAVPTVLTTFATAPPNVIRCGASYASNGILGTAINCAAGSTVPEMDITQWVKILYTDSIAAPRISQLEFTAVNE